MNIIKGKIGDKKAAAYLETPEKVIFDACMEVVRLISVLITAILLSTLPAHLQLQATVNVIFAGSRG